MARPPSTKWTPNTTPMLVAAVVDDSGKTVRTVVAYDGYKPAQDANTRISALFRLQGTPQTYTPLPKNSKLHLKCANPDCKAKLYFVPAHAYENDFDGNRAHFRSRNMDDHIHGCLFKNPKRDSDKKISVKTALENDMPIFVNIHFDTGFAGNARIGKDYLNDHTRWKMAHEGQPHAVEAVNTLPELITLRDRVAKAGAEKLSLITYGRNTMTLPHEHFWLAPQTQEEQIYTRDNQPDKQPYIAILRELLMAAEDPRNANTKEIFGMARVIAFQGDTGARIFDTKEPRLMNAKPIQLRGASWLDQKLHLKFLELDGYNIKQSRDYAQQMLEGGRRFLIAASPSLVLPGGPMERAKKMRELRAIVNGSILTADTAKNFTLNWYIYDREKQMTSAPYPERPVSPQYKSGAIPFGELPFDQAAKPHATLAPAAIPAAPLDTPKKPKGNDSVLGMAGAKQLRLL